MCLYGHPLAFGLQRHRTQIYCRRRSPYTTHAVLKYKSIQEQSIPKWTKLESESSHKRVGSSFQHKL